MYSRTNCINKFKNKTQKFANNKNLLQYNIQEFKEGINKFQIGKETNKKKNV